MLICWAKTYTMSRKTSLALILARNEVYLEMIADRPRYMFITHQQNAGQSHKAKQLIKSFNKEGNVCTNNVTSRCVSLSIVAMEKR